MATNSANATQQAGGSRQLKRNASKDADEAALPKEPRKDDGLEEDLDEDADEDVDDMQFEDDDEDAPKWAKSFNQSMEKMLNQMARMNGKVDKALNTSKEAKTAVNGLRNDVNDLRTEYGTFKTDVEKTVNEAVQKEVEKVVTSKLQSLSVKEDSDHEGVHPERLAVASGWPEGTSEETIIERLRNFISENSLGGKVVEVFCYSDPAMSGVLKFRSEEVGTTFSEAVVGRRARQLQENGR